MKGLKLVIKKKNENKKRDLLRTIDYRRYNNQDKRDRLTESLEKLIAFRKLIERNKSQMIHEKVNDVIMNNEIYGKINEDRSCNSKECSEFVRKEIVEKIQFPLIILGTQNCQENQINVCYSKEKNALALSFRKEFSIIGDMDMLLKLGFQRNKDNLQYTQDPYKIQSLIRDPIR